MLNRVWINLRADRRRPPLDALERIEDPEEFLWQILPYAARTFSLCIVFLPTRLARPLAVAYLYCRALDTYEDMLPDAASKEAALREFCARFSDDPECRSAPPMVAEELVQEERERIYLLLLRRIERIDAVYARLPESQREAVSRLVGRMATGMAWSARIFEEQDGSLRSPDQLARYCWNVLGTTLLFAEEMVRLDAGLSAHPAAERIEVCAGAGEAVQLANITRDVERDRERGIFYHPGLRSSEAETRRRAHQELVARALRLGGTLVRFLEGLPVRDRWSLTRGGGYLLVATTLAYYRSACRRLGWTEWEEGRRGAERTPRIVGFLRCVASARGCARVLRSVEEDFARAFASSVVLADARFVAEAGDFGLLQLAAPPRAGDGSLRDGGEE